MSSLWLDLLHNPTFWSALCGWLLAQFTKMICFFVRTRHINFGYLVSTGGMPSAHSTMASALVTSVAIRNGMDSALFALALAFAMVIMFDAQSVRRAAGMQARILNRIVDEMVKTHRLPSVKLSELLGHTRLEVLMGMIMGILTALLMHAMMMK